MQETFLFTSSEFSFPSENAVSLALTEIEAMSAEQALGSVEDLVVYLQAKYELTPPFLKPDELWLTDEEGAVLPAASPNPRFQSYSHTVAGTIYTLHLPYDGDGSFFHIRTYGNFNRPLAITEANKLRLMLRHRVSQPAEVDKFVEDSIAAIEANLAEVRRSVGEFNRLLPTRIRPALDARREKLQRDRTIASGLKYPLRRRTDAPATYQVPTIRPKIVKPPAVPTSAGTDPVLQDDHYTHILSVIESMTTVMERSPAVFAKLGEEDIRFHYLVQLNAQYDGDGVAEAFNFRGKTDILVRQNNQNLFIAECKFWDGPQSLTKTIDQIFRYTTWRDTKTAIIMFVDRVGFTQVVIDAAKTMTEHPQYLRGPIKEGETRFRYTFSLPSDRERHITLTLMLFHIPKTTMGA